jgi:hypothetical protein
MDQSGELRCALCGSEVTVVMHFGVDLYGTYVLKPALVQTEAGVFVLVECPCHGRIAKRVCVTGDVPEWPERRWPPYRHEITQYERN